MKVPQSTAGPLTIEVDGELALVAAFTDLDGTANDETLPEADRLGSVGPAKDGFRELQSRCGGISSSVLTDRLAELREAGIVERADDGYRLSARGAELGEIVLTLAGWAADWGPPAGK